MLLSNLAYEYLIKILLQMEFFFIYINCLNNQQYLLEYSTLFRNLIMTYLIFIFIMLLITLNSLHE